MPIKGDVKKDFLKMREMVRDSASLSTKLIVEKGLALARQDSIIASSFSAPTAVPYISKTGKKNYRFIERPEIPDMNRSTKDRMSKTGKIIKGKKVFSAKKFVDRTGSLLKAFTPAGSWSGNRLPTRGDSEITLQSTNDGYKAELKFTGRPEQALSHPGGRRPMDVFKKLVNVWNSALKKELDKRAREIK
ncbi:MAG: hypothetical protein LBC64_01880 [Fibromonadaceae bacterium]|jgi:hypothetical protein|nr:hypothetical protein [Fibromonadaceae bacterium]